MQVAKTTKDCIAVESEPGFPGTQHALLNSWIHLLTPMAAKYCTAAMRNF